MIEKAEIAIYKDDQSTDFQIEVRVEDETVWLTQAQMAQLFDATKQNVSLHIRNTFSEGELKQDATVKEYLTVQLEGDRKVKRKVLYYNLDVIISVGYRIKSLRGTQFRIWATKILRELLLKGYVLNYRLEKVENEVIKINSQINSIQFQINTHLPPAEGIFFDGQIFDAWQFVSDLVRSAKSSLILIDNYVDDSVLHLFAKRNNNVVTTIYTNSLTNQLKTDLAKYNQQYQAIKIEVFKKSHDRFLIIDQREVYHLGASLKDLGKKWFAFSKLNLDSNEILGKLA